jgi:hypothetical protein
MIRSMVYDVEEFGFTLESMTYLRLTKGKQQKPQLLKA